MDRGRHLVLYKVGLNLAPQGLEGQLRRAVTLPSGFVIKIERSRPLHFPQAVFWFEATFVSDQKEQDLLTVAIDVHYGRQVRHLDRLLDRSHLAAKPWSPLAEAPHPGLAATYPIARDRVVRTLSALANTYHRELGERLHRQLERIGRYYHDLRAEVEEQAQKARNREDDPAKFAPRLEALTREEELRSAELRRKSQLKVHLRLLNLLVVHQPKLLLHTAVVSASAGTAIGRLEWVWDPLIESIEAAVCPECRHPTFEFAVTRQGRLVCSTCAAAPKTLRRARAAVGTEARWKTGLARFRSGEQFLDDPSVDVGQAEVAAGVAVGELLVVEAQQMQDRGVEVVDVDLVGWTAAKPSSSVAPWT